MGQSPVANALVMLMASRGSKWAVTKLNTDTLSRECSSQVTVQLITSKPRQGDMLLTASSPEKWNKLPKDCWLRRGQIPGMVLAHLSPALGKPRQNYHEFEASLDYNAILYVPSPHPPKSWTHT